MAKLLEFKVEELTIPYKAPNGILNIFIKVENVDLIEVYTNSTIEIQIDNNSHKYHFYLVNIPTQN